MYSHVIWDFNGTLLDDVKIGIKTVNTLLKRRGLKEIGSIDEYHGVFGFPVIDYYRKLGFDFNREPFDDIAEEWIKVYLENVRHARIHDGITDILVYVKDKGIKQIILSATEQEMLVYQVEELMIGKFFDDILGIDNILGASKVGIALEWKEKNNPERFVLIGDTVHDYEVSKTIGADCVLIAAGHQSKKTLSQCNVPIFDNIKDFFNSGCI